VRGNSRAEPSVDHNARESLDPEPREAGWRAAQAEEATIRASSIGHCQWALTFDMSGGRKQAKLAGGRPLDGGVRRHALSNKLAARQPPAMPTRLH
jgi:hypothetical protein